MDTLEQKPELSGYDGEAASAPDGLDSCLERFLNLLNELGEGFAGEQARLRELKARLAEERFHLAVLGQFKRGKSTLLNALLGEPLLPTSVLPVTSVPTFLRFGPKRKIRVSFLDGKHKDFSDLRFEQAVEILATYVTEERNPENKLGIATVEADHPSPLLAQGVVMIDTPGIGSTLRHNTDATLNFLPQCDAAVFVVSADPPMTEVELEFLKAVRGKVARIFFVMNKIDYLTPAERGRAVEFLRKVIRKVAGVDESKNIFCVSARQGLEGKAAGDRALWEQSGLEQVENHLLEFLSRDKSVTVQSALARKSLDVLADTLMHIGLQRRSLEMPLRDLEERIKIFDEKIREMERERTVLADLLTGDRKRLAEFLEGQAEESRTGARRQLERVLSDALQEASSVSVERKVQDRLAKEIPLLFAEKLRALSDAVDARTHEVLRIYQDRADGLIETIRRTAAELFDIPYRAPDSGRAFERTHKPYWVTHNWNTLISPIPKGWIDSFLPTRTRRKRIRKKLGEDIETLVVHNVENIRWATLRNLDDAFRLFSAELDERLKQTVETTRGGIDAAHTRRKRQEQTVQPELQRLKLAEAKLADIREALAEFTAAGAHG